MTEALAQTVLQMGMTNYQPLADMVISRTVFRHIAFSTNITVKNFDILHVNKYVTWLRSIDKK